MNREFLTWYTGKQLYALPLERCKEVEKNLRLTPVPGARPHIAGIVNVRGDVVTVFDLGQLLRGRPVDRTDRLQIIRLKSTTTQIGIMAEEIDDILSLPEESLEEASTHMEEREALYIQYVANTGKGPVLVLDCDRLLAGAN